MKPFIVAKSSCVTRQSELHMFSWNERKARRCEGQAADGRQDKHPQHNSSASALHGCHSLLFDVSHSVLMLERFKQRRERDAGTKQSSLG